MASISLVEAESTSDSLIVTPIRVAHVAGIRAAEIELAYDPADFKTTSHEVRIGSLWKGRGSVVANIDEVAGIIRAYVFAAEGADLSEGSLMEIGFEPLNKETLNAPVTIDIRKLRLNEAEVTRSSDSPVTKEVGATSTHENGFYCVAFKIPDATSATTLPGGEDLDKNRRGNDASFANPLIGPQQIHG